MREERDEGMKVFVSWSGDKSHRVALALREWLPGLINSVDPFVSSKDIYAGTRWQAEIATELGSTNFGIVCVTRDNRHSPWLNFEAGALAKAVDASRVVPLAVDLKPSDIDVPLGQFQAQPATEAGMREIVRSVNASSDRPLSSELLERVFKTWWPHLHEGLVEIERTVPTGAAPVRSERELLEETLDTVRSLSRGPMSMAATAELPLGDDHPLLAELRDLLGEDARVVANLRRRVVGIRGGERVPPQVREEAAQRARVYGADVHYLASRRILARGSKPASAGGSKRDPT